jgi:dCTP deaminase
VGERQGLILSYPALLECWKEKIIEFKPDIESAQITKSSIDLRMGNLATRIIENPGLTIRPVLSKPDGIFEDEKVGESLIIKPQELVLVLTMERISMPAHLCAQVEGKSSFARFGLAVHITSPHIHPYFEGPITLELYNHSPNKLQLCPGDRICQLIVSEVSEPVPEWMAGAGRYQRQKTSKPKPEPASA